MLVVKNMQGEEFTLECNVHPAKMALLLVDHFKKDVKELGKQLEKLNPSGALNKIYLETLKNLLDKGKASSYN